MKVLILIAWVNILFFTILYANQAIALSDQEIAIDALNNLPKINTEDLTNHPDFKEMLTHDFNDNQNALSLIKESKSKKNTGKQLSNDLKKQAQHLEQQSSRLNEQQIVASSKRINEDLTPVEIVNKNLLDLETIPNAVNPATKAAFVALEQDDDKLQQTLGVGEHGKTALRAQYVENLQKVVDQEEYYMGCSTTLLSPEFTCTKSLVINVEKEPVVLRKLITTSFRVHSYNSSQIAVNFQHGNYRLIGGGNVSFSMSDSLGAEFGVNTIVLLKVHQPLAEEGCHNNLNVAPTFENGFTANYSNYQPGTDDYHWYSSRKKKKRAKNKRNLYRGATLQYEFVSAQPPRIINEGWEGTCGELEDLTILEECKLIDEVCIEGEDTRKFGNQAPYLEVKRPCWKKRLTFHCNIPQGDNDCDRIPSNCIKTGSRFKEFIGQKAVEIHNFKCIKNLEFTKSNLTNNGFKAVDAISYEKNTDFKDAVAGLSLIKEISQDVRQEGYGSHGNFFNGRAMHCTCKPKNCCNDKKGFWRKMTGCKNEEIQLAEQLKNGNCHLVGKYRVKNSLLQKIGHVYKQGYCCYQSKLSRVIQEGAKSQLNRHWGTGEIPQCEPLSVSDLERIDWSKINFNEIAGDFVKKAQQSNLSDSLLNAVSNNLTQITNKIQENYQQQLPQTPLRQEQAKYLDQLSQKISNETSRRKLHQATKKKQAEVVNEKK